MASAPTTWIPAVAALQGLPGSAHQPDLVAPGGEQPGERQADLPGTEHDVDAGRGHAPYPSAESTSFSAARKPSTCSGAWLAPIETRSRLVPRGTVGGRMAFTR